MMPQKLDLGNERQQRLYIELQAEKLLRIQIMILLYRTVFLYYNASELPVDKSNRASSI